MCASLRRNGHSRKKFHRREVFFGKFCEICLQSLRILVFRKFGLNFANMRPFEMLPYAYDSSSKVSSAHFFVGLRDIYSFLIWEIEKNFRKNGDFFDSFSF